MSVLGSAFSAAVRGQARSYNAAQSGRMVSDWIASATSSDAELRRHIRKLIDRSRDLERNNDYLRGFLASCERNVVGALRRDLRMDCGDYVQVKGQDKMPRWVTDWSANIAIETAWEAWGKKGTCTVCGRYSWRDLKNLAIRATARDGNFLVRKIFGPAARNRFGFALQVWEIDHLDLDRFDVLRNGNVIRFGIEMDPLDSVVAYYLKTRHPGDFFGARDSGSQVVRVAASEIVHSFVRERAEQTIGVPWCVSAITRLRQLGAFEEAATIAARIGAGKMGFFTKNAGPNGQVGAWSGETNAHGNGVIDAQPGTFEELPEGWNVASWSAEYPNIETGDFRKAMLRGVATSLGISYTTLGNDLESVSFSSSRVGLFEEREGWKSLQLFQVESLYEPIFSDFLVAGMASGMIALPLAKLDKFNRPQFKGRRWAMIDPLKEIMALKTAIALRVQTRRGFIEEQGGDVEDVFADTRADEALAADNGISLTPPDPEPTTAVSLGQDEPDGSASVQTGRAAPAPATRDQAGGTFAAAVRELKSALAELLGARSTPQSVNITAPAPVVNITNTPPAVRIDGAQVKVDNHVPQAAAPVVQVNVPPPAERAEPAPPVVNVTVPQAAPPVVNVNVPPMSATLELTRDRDGKLKGGKIK